MKVVFEMMMDMEMCMFGMRMRPHALPSALSK